jgi:hypothetical protein
MFGGENLRRILALAIFTIATVSATSSARAQRIILSIRSASIDTFGGERFECAYTSLALRSDIIRP